MKSLLVGIGMFISAVASAQKPLNASQLYARAEAAYDDGDSRLQSITWINVCHFPLVTVKPTSCVAARKNS
jgi:hypothetical protein